MLPRPDAKAQLIAWAGAYWYRWNFQYQSNSECKGSIHILDISSTFMLHMAAHLVFLTYGMQILLFGLVEELYTNTELFLYYIAIIQMLPIYSPLKNKFFKEIPFILHFLNFRQKMKSPSILQKKSF